MTLDTGRIVILLDRTTGAGTVSIRVDGIEVVRRMVAHERKSVDRGRLTVEVERTFGRSAELYLNIADDLRIDRPDRVTPTRDKPETPPFGGYL